MKNKIPILPGLILALILGLFLTPSPARAAEAAKMLAAFSGNDRLRDAVWRLAAFVPADGEGGERSLTVEGGRGLPPVTISLTFGEPLDPWPESLSLRFQAETTDPPVFFTLSDRRPFGGPNISLAGPEALEAATPRETRNPPALLLDILTRLNRRLAAGRPRLGPVNWREISPGCDLARPPLLYGARLGPADLFLVRFDPARFTFRPYQESEYPEAGPADIQAWGERLSQATALINGGQYYPDRSSMGLLSRGGKNLSAAAHPQWKGFLAAEPGPGAPAGAPAAALLDLAHPETLRPEHYGCVMQSFMLLDHRGNIRVRDSYNLAGRSAIGQDREGRLILIMTPAAISLYDLAMVLKAPALDLARVMGLDGGFEAQLLLRRHGTPFLAGGRFSITDNRALYLPGYRPPLPAVLAVEPLPPGPQQ